MSRVHVARQGYITSSTVLPVLSRTRATVGAGSTDVFLLKANTGNTFSDLGGNTLTITKNGTINYSATTPFSSTYGSADFGTGSGWLAPANNTVFAWGTGNWTYEAFIYLTARPTSGGLTPLLDTEAGGNGTRPNSLIVYLTSTGVCEIYQNGAARVSSGANTFPLNAWTHIACVRNGSTTTIYKDGTSVGSANYAWSNLSNQAGSIGLVANVGNATSQYGITGLVSNHRVWKGSAVYTGNFTKPSADLSNGGSGGTTSTNTTTYGVFQLV
jgi:hypothetical protein